MIMLDSAATSVKPKFVIDAVSNYMVKYGGVNVHRGVCKLSQEASVLYDNARKYVAGFINAKSEQEIIFTSGTTHSLNLAAYSLCKSFDMPERDIIIASELDHNSNFVVWQQYCLDTHKKRLFTIPVLPSGLLDYDSLEIFLQKNGRRVFAMSFCHVSNAIGTINDVYRLTNLCKKYDIISIVDAAQSVSHIPIDVQKMDCDFLAFSGHKIYAPFGTGVLYGKNKWLQMMHPMTLGGGAVVEVGLAETELKGDVSRFEAGTQNLSGNVGLHAALSWFSQIGWDIIKDEHDLYVQLINGLRGLPNFKIIGTPQKSTTIVSIVHKSKHPGEVATILSENNVCVRSGWHCAHNLMKKLNLPDGTCRLSLSFLNTPQEIDYTLNILKTI